MIETKLICQNPAIVYHKVTELSDDKDVFEGVVHARSVLEDAKKNNETFNLLMDFTTAVGEAGYKISAHRIWAKEFKEHETVKNYVRHVAVVGKDSPKFRAEKSFMQAERHKWFIDYEEALDWLKTAD